MFSDCSSKEELWDSVPKCINKQRMEKVILEVLGTLMEKKKEKSTKGQR